MTELLNTLYIQSQGASLHLDTDSVRIVIPETEGRKTLPLLRLESIVVFGHVSVSSELLTRCAEDGRAIVWMSRSGRYLSRTEGPTRGNVLLRHAQHLAYADSTRRLTVARPCIAGKIQNSRRMLLRGARDGNTRHRDALRERASELAELIESLEAVSDLDTLRGKEGNAARIYFSGLSLLFRSDLDVGRLTSRVKRPATDPINALLSFAYGLLRSSIHGGAEQVGLDPYVGFLHGIRPGKPSLALDLMEEFRPILADRFVVTLLNRRQVRAEHFETLPGGAVQLTEEGRKVVLTEWQRWKQREWPHRLLGRRVVTALLPSVQARILARYIRGELGVYVPWTVR